MDSRATAAEEARWWCSGDVERERRGNGAGGGGAREQEPSRPELLGEGDKQEGRRRAR